MMTKPGLGLTKWLFVTLYHDVGDSVSVAIAYHGENADKRERLSGGYGIHTRQSCLLGDWCVSY